MRRWRPLPDQLGTAFSVRQAREAGVGRGRLRDGRLRIGVHGARALPQDAMQAEHPDAVWRRELLRRAIAYAQVMPAGAFFVGRTAAAAWGVPVRVPPDRSLDLDVAVLHPHRAPRSCGVRARQMRPHLARVTMIGGLRVAAPATMWATLATDVDHQELVRVADRLLHVDRMPGSNRVVRPARAEADDLRAVIVRRPGRQALARALEDARVGSASVRETDLRLALIDAGLPEPELDVDVYDDGGCLLGCSEMVFRPSGVVAEYEGDQHRTRRQWNRDIAKYEAYAKIGLTVVRVTAEDLAPTPERAVTRIRDALVRGGWRPPA